MILQALVRYYESLVKQGKIARLGWVKTRISYALCIDEHGHLEKVTLLLVDPEQKSVQSFDLPAPVKRTSGIKPNFLWDNAAYMLGVDAKGKPEWSVKCFEASRAFHHQLLDKVDSPVAKGITAFFDNWKPSEAKDHPALQENFEEVIAGRNLLFCVNGTFAQEDEAICQAWQEHYDRREGERQQCLVTGKEDIIEVVHPAIKGVDGAQSTGAALVSFNAPAFCSYGHEQGYNAPVGKYAAFAYTSALNYLLADWKNVVTIGDMTIVCWAEGAEAQYQELTRQAVYGTQEDTLGEDVVRCIVKRLAEGKPAAEPNLMPDKPFYVLGLSPNAARLSVRFFYQGTFGNLMKNINAHYERMEIDRASFDKWETIPPWLMLKETVNPFAADKKPSPILAGATVRSIFFGDPYPAMLLEQTMLRIHAERDINRGKASIIKAYYLRNKNEDCPEEVLTVALNEASTNPAYTLGRLFSVYEALQAAANPGINTTIKDKYFNAAASTPATIFPLLTNLSQKHLRKLDYGLRFWYENQIMALMAVFGESFPEHLNLAQQAAFDLGYYHQTRKRYEKKEKENV